MKVKIIFVISFILIIIIYFLLRQSSIQTTKEINFSNMIGFNNIYMNRYLDYQRKNKNLTTQEIINHVNIGIDKPFYSSIETIKENGYITLVNKYLRLDENYKPNDLKKVNENYNPNDLYLRSDAKDMFELMASDASIQGLNLIMISGYRSYSYQYYLYSKYKDQDGIMEADKYSARPGHSEHQTGLVIDLRNKDLPYEQFGKTKEFTWLNYNAYKYGFILRYPNKKEQITGYIYEPWHYRYVGVDIATDMYLNYPNLTFDEYYYQVLTSK